MSLVSRRAPLPLLRTLTPPDFGGINARRGFAFQDHVAAHCCLEMLLNSEIREVCCETYDDVVLFRQRDGEAERVEFVQVKDELIDQLWSCAVLCERKRAKKGDKHGASILEKSLTRDCCHEDTSFRLVTSRDVAAKLRILKLELGHADRIMGAAAMKELSAEVREYVGDFVSAKGHKSDYWLQSTQWQVFSEQELILTNKRLLALTLENEGLDSSVDSVDSVYTDLLAHVKRAAELPWDKRSEKALTAAQLRHLISEWTEPFPNLKQTERLEKKLTQAGLDETYVETAKDLRRNYLQEYRTGRFLETDQRDLLGNAVLTTLLALRSQLDSGAIDNDGVNFHESCRKAVAALVEPAEGGTSLGFVEGCMYDITARCKHRFVRMVR